MSENDALLHESILAPIAEGTPAGRDLTYDPDMERLAAEVEKSASLAGEAPDWDLVRRESARLLREASKDMRLASWWVAASAIAGGWPAAAEGVATYKALVERHWEPMFPPLKRARARAGLVSWLWEQLQRSLSARAVTLADADAVRALEASVFAFDAALAEKLGDLYAGLGGLRGVLREKVRSIPEPPKAEAVGVPAEGPRGDERPGGPSAGTAIPVVAAPTVGTVASVDAGEAAAEEWRGGLATLAHHVRSVAPTSAWPYRLARIAAWLTLEAAPAAESGKTFVRAPKASERTDLTGMFEAGAWEGLRDAAEDALSEHIFWLDLHRWSALALERLGPPFAAARDAVGRETAALLARLPGLSSLYFANGTPFASPETVDWLASEGARWGGGGGAPTNRAAGAADDAAAASLAAAEAKVTAGQVDEGLAAAVDLANHAAGAATRFRAQLQAAKLAHRAGKADLALALIDRLLPAVDATLEAWEPSVCADFFETALRILRASSPESIDRQTLLFRRLLQVDPAAALRIG